MSVQPKAWMTNILFQKWMLHFIHSVPELYGISPTSRHLLILDGHKSHVSLDVIRIAKAKGLDLLTFPSHTSHAMQPLDVTCFKPFKQSFRAYRDKWTLDHPGQMPIKDDLAQWVSFALKRALSKENITKGFQVTGIFLLNATAMNSKMGPSEVYQRRQKSSQAETEDNPSGVQELFQLQEWEIEEIFNEIPEDVPNCRQYYVDVDGVDQEDCAGTTVEDISYEVEHPAASMEGNTESTHRHEVIGITDMERADVIGQQRPHGTSANFCDFL